MSKDIAKDMTGALTRVDEKVGVFNKQVEALNKSQDNFSRIFYTKTSCDYIHSKTIRGSC